MDIFPQILTIIAAFFAYSLIHSFFATQRVKRYFEKKLSFLVPFYRIIYVTTQTVLLVWMFSWLPRPKGYVWNFDGPVYWLLRGIQIAGIVGFILTLREFDLKEFLGIKQLKQRTESVKIEQLTLNLNGLFRYMRHPLYFFSIVIFLFEPRMTVFKFLLLIWLILYFWIGSILEEKRMIARFGEVYIRYQQRVNRFFPTFKLKR